MGGNPMKNLEMYRGGNPTYHFESSEKYCSNGAIDAARKRTLEDRDWSSQEIKQLDTITRLEALRARYAVGEISHEEYRNELEAEVDEFSSAQDLHPFAHTDIHDRFYSELNEEATQ
jgi:hypothetical protein